MREDDLGQVNDRINDMISEIPPGIETSLLKRRLSSNTDKYRDKRHSSKEGALPDKEFLARNSILDDLFAQITHIRTVYNLFMVTFLLFFLSTAASDIMESGTTDTIRWRVVIKNLIEVGLVIFYLAFILERLVGPTFEIFGTQYVEPKWVLKNVIEASIPGILFFISGNYLLLHAWMNAWAEMLQFADRLFYKASLIDWWNSTTYRTYYRTWNVVVHDWLYTYIYKDMYEIVVPRNKMLATLAVFLVSAAFHEYVLAFAFRFFYPVMFVMFGGFGFCFIFIGKLATSNVLMWFSFCLGNGIMFSSYTMEYYARLNCPSYSNYYLDLLAPRSWVCQTQFVA
ncbi:sterol o-acyltransferase 1 [Lasius niger]|uniref:Sterol o-acyltransferase 1 n=1 Tax=Lasius niger TaxID=67767 RepID=A0A0J7N3A8_LASNI|nr:sterol o-acyltransferase 1 [Lasius niger]